MAVYNSELPTGKLFVEAGVTAIEESVAAVTVRVVVPDLPPNVAVIVVVPGATADALPLVPPALLMVALEVSDELHVTDAVKFCVVLLEYVPVAVNCCVKPAGLTEMLGLAGVTAMETSVALVAVRVVVPEIVPRVAVIVVEPAAAADAIPLEPTALLMVALEVSDELHVTADVKSWVVPLE